MRARVYKHKLAGLWFVTFTDGFLTVRSTHEDALRFACIRLGLVALDT